MCITEGGRWQGEADDRREGDGRHALDFDAGDEVVDPVVVKDVEVPYDRCEEPTSAVEWETEPAEGVWESKVVVGGDVRIGEHVDDGGEQGEGEVEELRGHNYHRSHFNSDSTKKSWPFYQSKKV